MIYDKGGPYGSQSNRQIVRLSERIEPLIHS
jgi:hypothetical protein